MDSAHISHIFNQTKNFHQKVLLKKVILYRNCLIVKQLIDDYLFFVFYWIFVLIRESF